MLVKEIYNYKSFRSVLYTQIGVNLTSILDEGQTDQAKAETLARLAIDSVTGKTFDNFQDGIYYLDTVMNFGVRTRLTGLYYQTILRLTNDSPDLAEARLRVAREKGITTY